MKSMGTTLRIDRLMKQVNIALDLADNLQELGFGIASYQLCMHFSVSSV